SPYAFISLGRGELHRGPSIARLAGQREAEDPTPRAARSNAQVEVAASSDKARCLDGLALIPPSASRRRASKTFYENLVELRAARQALSRRLATESLCSVRAIPTALQTYVLRVGASRPWRTRIDADRKESPAIFRFLSTAIDVGRHWQSNRWRR